jgi:hypothetical protein
MKLATAKEHRDFFQQKGRIEFADLFNKDQLVKWNQALDETFQLRGISSSPENRFINGHDLWRFHAELRRLTLQPQLAVLAAELSGIKPLRLGYTQFFPSYQEPIQITKDLIYAHFLSKTMTLEQFSSIQGLVGGAMICLSAGAHSEKLEETIFPQQAGHVTFFKPDIQLDLSHLYLQPEHRYYLIVYTHAMAQYIAKPDDPHMHALKHLGYIIYDRLNDKLHPIAYR